MHIVIQSNDPINNISSSTDSPMWFKHKIIYNHTLAVSYDL